MKRIIALILIIGVLFSIVSCKLEADKEKMLQYTVETIAMGIGYEAQKRDFEWTDDVNAYYESIMAGNLELAAAQKAEDYLRTVTHPLIANRMVELARMIGFNMDAAGQIIDVEKVNIALLQKAASGFYMGLHLKEEPK